VLFRSLGIEESTDVAALLHALAVLAANLDIVLVAEGVETQRQVEALQEVGCEFAQGYLFSRPLIAEDLVEFVRGPQRTQRLSMKSGPVCQFGNPHESTQVLS
jgi:EAL domain-containing protein (putative c-di-GMP-specific phosphodiesterase class I)